ncbi:MAG: hypothetical protein GKR93_17225 [Gammaproteobacteria bacterium]|nr:hypothetical protein [Gammaproteobacteria bacterium]
MSIVSSIQQHKELIRRVLFLAGLLFVFSLVWKSWEEIRNLLESVKPMLFILSILVGLFGTLTVSVFFNRLLAKNGVILSDRLAVKIYLVGQIAKYIPGKIWGIAYQISHVAGAKAATGVVLANMENMFIVIYMTSLTALILLSIFVEYFYTLGIVVLGIAGFLFIYRTGIILRIVKLLLQVIGQQNFAPEAGECKKPGYIEGFVFCLVFCSAYAFSYILMLEAVFDHTYSEAFIYIALLSVAWIGGVLTILVPAGMGVRELIFVAFASQVIPEQSMESVVFIAVVTRFWQLIQELTIMPLLFFLRSEKQTLSGSDLN